MSKKTDGNLTLVDKSVLAAAENLEQWIADRRRNWPTKERVAAKKKELELAKTADQSTANTASTENTANNTKPNQNNTNAGKSGKNLRKRPICRYFRNGKCKNGDQCRFSHDLRTDSEEGSKPNAKTPRLNVYKRYETPVKSSLFVKLVQSDHDAEDELLLKFIEYLNKKKLL